MTKGKIYIYIGCIIFIAIIVLSVINCVNTNAKERKRAEMLEREQFVNDSLAHDPHYQDSIVQEEQLEEQRRKWKSEHEVVIVRDSDLYYHTSTECCHVSIRPETKTEADAVKPGDFRIITYNEAIKLRYTLCPECEEINSLYPY